MKISDLEIEDQKWLERTARHMARAACGARWRGHSDDAAQEAVIAGLGALQSGKDRAVVAVAARRGARRYLRRLCGVRFQRAALVETMEIEDYYHEMAAPDADLEAVVDNAGVEALLALLSDPRDRRMVRAWIVDRDTHEIIAAREGCCRPEATKTIGEALRRLRELMEGNEELMGAYGV